MSSEKLIPFYRPPKNLNIAELLPDWAQVYDSGMLSNGENCRSLEEQVKTIHKCDHVISCSSATAALWILLKTLRPHGIAMPAFTWKSVGTVTTEYVQRWMDIDKDTWLPDPTSVIGPFDTLLFQHTFGSIIRPQMQVKETIIHDAAYSLGLEFPVNDGAVISMSPTKTVTSCEGGLILLNSEKNLEEITELRDTCARLSELNAVLGLHYLEKLAEILIRKKQICEYYRQHLPYQYQKILIDTTYGYYGMLLPEGIENETFRSTPGSPIYTINGVECRVRYESLAKALPGTNYMKQLLPNTEYIERHILCIPCYCDVNEKEVAEKILEYPMELL